MKNGFPIIRCCLCVAVTAGLFLTPNVNVFNSIATANEYVSIEEQQKDYNAQVNEQQTKLKSLQSEFSSKRLSEINYLDAVAIKDAFSSCSTAIEFEVVPLELIDGQWSQKEYYLSIDDCDGLDVTVKTNDIPATLDYIDSLNLLITNCIITNDTVKVTICIKEGAK